MLDPPSRRDPPEPPQRSYLEQAEERGPPTDFGDIERGALADLLDVFGTDTSVRRVMRRTLTSLRYAFPPLQTRVMSGCDPPLRIVLFPLRHRVEGLDYLAVGYSSARDLQHTWVTGVLEC